MAITKTDFIEFSRCPRYAALKKKKKDKLLADISYEDYKKQELENQIEELLSSMFEYDEQGNEKDKTKILNKQLEVMLPYYKRVEEEAGIIVSEIFKGKTIYAEKTKDQVSFDFKKEKMRFLCYVDIYN